MKQLLFMLAFFSIAFAASPADWQTEMSAELTQKLETEVAFKQSGPQSIFYADTLPEGSRATVLETLGAYADNVDGVAYITVVGLRPEIAYRANASHEAEEMTNTSIVAEYASLVDGRVRDIGLTSGQSFTGCISSSNSNGSSIRCSDGSSKTYESRCQYSGKEIVCSSND